MKKFLLVFAVTVFAAAPVMAEELKPADFAAGLTLEMEEGGALYELPVPPEVYRGVTGPEVSDLRFFNADGRVVPHTSFRRYTRMEAEIPEERAVKLPFFPLHREPGGKTPDLAMQIRTDGQGAIIDIRSGASAENGRTVDAYILDASALNDSPDRLDFTWQGAGFMFKTAVLGSNDLTDWRPLVSGSTLADLSYQDNALRQAAVILPPRRYKYLKVAWQGEARLESVRAVFVSDVPDESEDERNWLELSVAPGENEGEYLLDCGGYMPLDRLRLSFPERNTVVRAYVWSRNDPAAPWQQVTAGLYYHLEIDGEELAQDLINLPPASRRYLKIRLDPASAGWTPGSEALRVGWIPDRLVFVARGGAPYTLAFGSATVGRYPSDLNPVLKDLRYPDSNLIRPARTGARIELGGAARLALPVDWKGWILWAVLILGVALIAAMAATLYRDMNRKED